MSPAPALPPDLPRPGDLIAGKYEVESVLGAGGMGVVIAARHTALRQRVAVKFLLPAAMRLPEASARFLREAQAAVAIQSEHVARVHDVGTLENGAPYIVMEHLSGTDLARVLKERGALPVEEAIDFALQAIEAIAEAHALGIIHRDLKPANLFLTRRAEGSPLIKVLDFGLSKMAPQDGGAPEASLTASNAVIGSPHYMSPEQLRSLKRVDQRTDIWALGVILYELLTATRPFDGTSLTEICMSVATNAPPPLGARRPDVPPGVEAVILRCLEKDPARRLSSVAEIAAGLAPFAPARAWSSVEHIVRLLPGANMPAPPARPPHASAPPQEQPPSMASTEPLPPSPQVATEQLPPRPPLETDTPSPTPDATAQIGAWEGTEAGAPRRPRRLIATGLGAAVIGAGVLGWLFLARAPVTMGPQEAPSPSALARAPASTTAAPGTADVSAHDGAPASAEPPAPTPSPDTATASVETPPVQPALTTGAQEAPRSPPRPAPQPKIARSARAPAPKPIVSAAPAAAPEAPPPPAPRPAVRPIDRPD
jgi:serine/threonine-protein kinase